MEDLGLRTHKVAEISATDIGKTVTLCGWTRRRRDHGGLVFIDLADVSGIAQVVFTPDTAEAFKLGESLRAEYVVKITGEVRARPEGTVNPKLPTGEVEVEVTEAELLSEAKTPPLLINEEESETREEIRLQYRFLDLRRPAMLEVLKLRHKVYQSARSYLSSKGFCEVETPILTKPTPEGARDFLVPSRMSHGEFYALPQSPQLFKQVLMCSGLDRYFQVVKCFRDEDFRANRQPEFTQIDIELSFTTEEQVRAMAEGLVRSVWKECAGKDLPEDFPRIGYDEAMDRFGVDAPDTRFGLELSDLSDLFADSEFQVFKSNLESGGVIKGICLEGGADLSRKDFDRLTEFVGRYDAKGLAWFKFEDGEVKSPIKKFLTDAQIEKVAERLDAGKGDAILMVADQLSVANGSLGALRCHLAKERGLYEKDQLSFLWVEKFPLFDFDSNQGRFVAVHHPFTAPLLESDQDRKDLSENPGKLKARAYDLVLNGQELAGGSIRIHDNSIQREVFKQLGISDDEAEKKFGFLLDALSFGAPPHGGIAFGLDRMMMILTGCDSIRDVIAFHKTARGIDLMVGAPSAPDLEQLVELGVKISAPAKAANSKTANSK